MRCPYCGHQEDRVVDSRELAGASQIRRRRECTACARRFTTYERIEEVRELVVKRDGRREPYDRRKVLGGLLRACEKRPVSLQDLEACAEAVEAALSQKDERGISSEEIGRILMEQLRELDQVAYVRFASVYRRFEDIDEFLVELRKLRVQHRGSTA